MYKIQSTYAIWGENVCTEVFGSSWIVDVSDAHCESEMVVYFWPCLMFQAANLWESPGRLNGIRKLMFALNCCFLIRLMSWADLHLLVLQLIKIDGITFWTLATLSPSTHPPHPPKFYLGKGKLFVILHCAVSKIVASESCTLCSLRVAGVSAVL